MEALQSYKICQNQCGYKNVLNYQAIFAKIAPEPKKIPY